MTRRHVAVNGRVQGVGFRWFAAELAGELGLSGWARNRDDGSVEIEVEGEDRALDEFVRRLRDGNPAARVDAVVAVPAAPGGGKGFQIR